MLRLHRGTTEARCTARLRLVNFRSHRSASGLELDVNSVESVREDHLIWCSTLPLVRPGVMSDRKESHACPSAVTLRQHATQLRARELRLPLHAPRWKTRPYARALNVSCKFGPGW